MIAAEFASYCRTLDAGERSQLISDLRAAAELLPVAVEVDTEAMVLDAFGRAFPDVDPAALFATCRSVAQARGRDVAIADASGSLEAALNLTRRLSALSEPPDHEEEHHEG